MKTCECGGEMYVDSFDPIKCRVEWFHRCGRCGATTESCATKEAAEAQATTAAADA